MQRYRILEHVFYTSDNISGHSVLSDNLVVIVLGLYAEAAVSAGVEYVAPFDGERPPFEGVHGCHAQVEV